MTRLKVIDTRGMDTIEIVQLGIKLGAVRHTHLRFYNQYLFAATDNIGYGILTDGDIEHIIDESKEEGYHTKYIRTIKNHNICLLGT